MTETKLRRVIELGGNFVISLPRTWIRNLCLKKGDAIELDVEENFIVVRVAKKCDKK
jgi:antitoxin component of MazEF toxin-antitoxin module